MSLLKVENLHARVDGKDILKGINLEIAPGEVHAIMGPNGSGKSTLSGVLAGRESYTITEGRVLYDGKDLLAMSAEERSNEGVFLGFQYPVEIPGVSNAYFMRAAVNAHRKHRGLPEIDAAEFMRGVKQRLEQVKIDSRMLSRGVNEGFSGGEKKRNEILQMLVLEPRLMILDETDSGLDIDALKIVADGINAMRSPERATLMITHYQRLLDYVVPDRVHVLSGGRIVKSGGPDLARELEERGYGWLDAA